MTTLTVDLAALRLASVSVTDDALIVDLADGRTIWVPLTWYPRLLEAEKAERQNFRLIGTGEGIHWPQLDEDISAEGLIAGRTSGESASSFRKWLDARRGTGAATERDE